MKSVLLKLLLPLAVVIHHPAFAQEIKPKVCLNMIVKNETPVISRCLKSVIPLIDYWVIVDTGSTDGTQQLIQETLKNVPGELHERKWLNFGHNRNEALELAKGKGDYILIIDADEELILSDHFSLPLLDKDFYYIETVFGGTRYKRVQLINGKLDWKWVGVVHEVVDSPHAKSSSSLVGVTNLARPEGNRSQDPLKYQKDASLLEEAVTKEPANTRYVFYLAQSYRDAGDHEKALQNYEKRAKMGGWDQEVFWALVQAARMKDILKQDPQQVVESYKKAYEYRQTRIEPLYYLTLHLIAQKEYEEAYRVASQALQLKETQDILFVEQWIYDYAALLEYSVAAYWTERYLEAYLASKLLLTNKELPENFKQVVEKNLQWIEQKIHEAQAAAPFTFSPALATKKRDPPDHADPPIYSTYHISLPQPDQDVYYSDTPHADSFIRMHLYSQTHFGKSIGECHNYQTVGLYADVDNGCLRPFLDLRCHALGDHLWAGNCGAGMRWGHSHSGPSWSVNGFYDYRYFSGAYQQLGIGSELNFHGVSIVCNCYHPIGHKHHYGVPVEYSYLGDYYAIRRKRRRALAGADIELGTNWNDLPLCIPFSFYCGLGAYHYSCHQKESFTGVRFRGEICYRDLISLEILATHDTTFSYSVQGVLTLNISFDHKGIVFPSFENCLSCSVSQPVQRQEIIVLAKPTCCWQTNFAK